MAANVCAALSITPQELEGEALLALSPAEEERYIGLRACDDVFGIHTISGTEAGQMHPSPQAVAHAFP